MKTTIFLSWSGSASKQIANTLSDWLSTLFVQGIDIWMSDERIQAGSRWTSDITQSLAQCSFGIICLTPDNRQAPWILFEAGALSNMGNTSMVIPYLFQLSPSDVEFPLAQFQSVESNKPGTWSLVDSINLTLEEPIDKTRLRLQFEKWWPELAESIGQIEMAVAPENDTLRSDRDILVEILDLVREDVLTRQANQFNILKALRINGSQTDTLDLLKSATVQKDIIEEISKMFPTLSKSNLSWVISAIKDNNKTLAIWRLRRETGTNAKAAKYLADTIESYLCKGSSDITP